MTLLLLIFMYYFIVRKLFNKAKTAIKDKTLSKSKDFYKTKL